MKGHYFFFNAATAPVIPFMPVIARQLGFSETVIGIIYTILPFLAMLAKPIMGGIADKYKMKKTLFITFQIFMGAALLGINFIPAIPKDSRVHFSCGHNTTVFDTIVGNNTIEDKCAATKIMSSLKNQDDFRCQLSCNASDSKMLETMCKYWLHGLQFCLENKQTTLDLSAVVPKERIEVLEDFMVFRVANVGLSDGSVSKPICPPHHQISLICDMNCDSYAVNDVVSVPRIENTDVVHVYQFWVFLFLAIFAWVGMAVVVSISDAICFELLEDKPHLYGHQRLWGSVGWGVFSIFAGLMIDAYSDNGRKDYTSVFYLMLGLMIINVFISSRLRYTQQKLSSSILRDVGKLLSHSRIFIYLVWCIFVGACTGFIWQSLFWHIEDVAKEYDDQMGECGTNGWIKTLEGLAMGIQCLGGELPFFFLSGWIIKKIGHVHCMTTVLLGIGIRYILYSFLTNPWWVLPIELMNGITFGLFYATMASYASIVAPPGTEATTQGLVGAVFEGVGVSLGSLIGGIIYEKYGGWWAFRIFGLASLVCCVVHVIAQHLVNRTSKKEIITHYAPPQEAVRIMDEDQDMTFIDQ